MTHLGSTKHVSRLLPMNIMKMVIWEISYFLSVHRNKGTFDKLSTSQGKEKSTEEVETFLKDKMVTEYEFYNYIKKKLANQVSKIFH